jgi:predicted Zn finger-like uncharacterized protein
MFTTCPKCALNLALTVADLRLGQGYVRCGRCANVFNALPALTDEGEADDSASATATRPAMDLDAMRAHDEGVASIQVLEPDVVVEPTVEPAVKPAVEPVAELAAETATGGTDATEATGQHEVLRTGTFETIILEGDGITQTEETVAESEVDAQLQALVQRFDAVREADALREADAERKVDAERNAELDAFWPPGEDANDDRNLADEPTYGLDDEDDVASDAETISPDFAASVAEAAATAVPVTVDPTPSPGDPLLEGDDARQPRQRAWLAGSVALALLLVAQVVHHFREELASQPWVAGPLTNVYRLFHITLEPRWDLAAYEVRQLGADAVPGTTPRIAVRASVRNRASRAQPPPLLRIVLQDRFGKELSKREVAPADYLRGSPPPTLGADQRIDASLTLPDPGQNAVGFEIDACLRSAAGVLRCASDPPAP